MESKNLVRFTESNTNGVYTAELTSLPEFGDLQIFVRSEVDFNCEYQVEKIKGNPDWVHKMKEVAITDMTNDFLARILYEIRFDKVKIDDLLHKDNLKQTNNA